MFKQCLLLAASISLSGCWSLMYHLDGERCVYPGTRHGWAWGTKDVASTWPWLIDVPFSLALDTLFCPTTSPLFCRKTLAVMIASAISMMG